MGERQRAIQTYDQLRVSDSTTRPANTTAYAAGDVISAITTDAHLSFNVTGSAGKYTGTILSARCTSSANQATKPDLELWLFHTDITEVADNLPFAPTDAETLTLLGVIDFPVASFVVGNAGSGADGNIVQNVTGINLPYVTIPATSSNSVKTGTIYGQLVVRNAYTPVSSEVFTVELTVAQD